MFQQESMVTVLFKKDFESNVRFYDCVQPHL